MAPTNLLRFTTQAICRASISRPNTVHPTRLFSATSKSLYPRKDSQDKDSINTEASEYSKSGTDDGAAQQDDAAFNPDTTSPEAEKKQAGEGQEGNPLEVSPANPEVSKQRPQQEGGAENSPSEGKRSGGGSPAKSG